MRYYDTGHTLDILRKAFDGDKHARGAVDAISVPHAAAPDYSALVLVQMKVATIYDGRVIILNMPPDGKRERRQVADIYRCYGESASWTSVPIPAGFPVSEMRHEQGMFTFISHGRAVAGTIDQITEAMLDVTLTAGGVSEPEVEDRFLRIPCTVATPRVPKSAAENPPVHDQIGTFTFDERLQWFTAQYASAGYSLELMLDADSRDGALILLPIVHDVIDRLESIDSAARAFAADELLELKNDTWLQDGEEPVNKADFVSRMSLESISFQGDGGFEIGYSDGGLFLGHGIVVCCGDHGMPEGVDIFG